jgi:hypothetical protein
MSGCLGREGRQARGGVGHILVEHDVVLADEHVAQNPQRATRGGDVNSGHTEQTDRLTGLTDLIHVATGHTSQTQTQGQPFDTRGQEKVTYSAPANEN